MFDADSSGTLSRDEFHEMIRASVALDLGQLLHTTEGEEQMEVQLQKEFAQETIRFWHEAVNFREQPGQLSGLVAKNIYEQYVREGAAEEINLPSKLRHEIERSLAAAAAEGRPPPADLFVRAEQVIATTLLCCCDHYCYRHAAPADAQEMFALMERNAFTRLRGDSQVLDAQRCSSPPRTCSRLTDDSPLAPHRALLTAHCCHSPLTPHH